MNVGINGGINGAFKDLVARLQPSLVAVHNGRHGVGAGVIWRGEGIILTNDHVLGRGHPRLTLSDGRELPAQILARKADFDLAVLQVEAAGLRPAAMADSRRLQVGTMVLAVGHPWGQRNTVTAGIISGLGIARTRHGHEGVPILRSDVQLAPGNSGGPLVDLSGGVVGINTLVVGGDLGVAIPSHVAASFLEEVLGEEAGGRLL